MYHSILFIFLSSLLYVSSTLCVINVSYAQAKVIQQTCASGEVMVGIDQQGKIMCTSITRVLESEDPSALEAVLRAQRRKHRQEKRKRKQAELDREEPFTDQWIKQLTPLKYQVIKNKWLNYITQIGAISKSARIIPYQNLGMKVFRIRKKSLLHKLGFKHNDIVMSVNKMKINTFNQALKIYESIRTVQSIDIELKRHGEVIKLQYQLVDQF